MLRKFRSLQILPFAVIFLLLAGLPARAQYNASIEGTVKDQNGGGVPKAAVSATDQTTGRVLQTDTGDSGFYRIPGLAPGKYTVAVEGSGFKKSETKDVIVEAEQVRGLDISLEIGAVTQTVEVNGDAAAALQTETASVSSVLTSDEITQLPQVGRDPYELLRLAPGVFGDGARSGNGQSAGLPNHAGPGGSNSGLFQTENQVQISANGQRTSGNNFTIDGVSANSLGFGGAAVVTPNQDSIQEIQVLSTSYSAEDGRNSGAQIKVITKTGTNVFHGGGFFNYQTPNLNAFNKYGGINNAPPIRVDDNFRQFGGNIGGPVFKDRLFFFFSYEGLRNRGISFENHHVETADYRSLVSMLRAGSNIATIFSDPGIAPRIAAIIPQTCMQANLPASQCQEVGPGGASGLDLGSPIGTTGTYVPFTGAMSNEIGGGFDGRPDIQFAQIALPSHTIGNQYNARVDYNRNKDQFAVSTFITHLDAVTAEGGAQGRPMADVNATPLNTAATLLWNRTFTSTLLNEARVNFTRFAFNQLTSNTNVNFGVPRIQVEGFPFDQQHIGADRQEGTPGIFAQNTYSFRDTVSKVLRNHATKFGVEITREQDNNNLLGGARPLYSFHRLWNLANGTPIFEAINAAPTTGGPAGAQRYFRTNNYSLFAQDDWKFRPNLTFNIGLRYEYFSPLHEKRGQITNLSIPGGVLTNAKLVPVGDLYQPDRNNFAPRLGFAWNPKYFDSRMVVRGGFGVAYNRIPDVLFTNTRGNPPNFARFNICCGTSPLDVFGSPFAGGQILYALGANKTPTSYPFNPALASGIDPSNGGVCAATPCVPGQDVAVEIYGAPSNLRTPYVFLYSLETETRLFWRLVGTIGYQGSTGRKLIRLVNQNFLQVPNPAFFAVFFPTGDVNSSYNSLNLRLRREFAQGFQFNVNYRLSSSRDALSNEGPGAQTNQTDPAHLRTEYGPSDFDATHSISAFAIWDLPIFRGRHDLVGNLLGGWQINGVLSAHSGFPWTPVTGFQGSVAAVPGAATIAPTRPVQYFGGAHSNFSTSTFTSGNGNFPGIISQATGNCGDPIAANHPGMPYFDICKAGPPGVGRNSFRGPRYLGFDFSLAKKTYLPAALHLGEGANVEMRISAFNLFNKLNLQPFGFNTTSTLINDPNFGLAEKGLAGRVLELRAKITF